MSVEPLAGHFTGLFIMACPSNTEHSVIICCSEMHLNFTENVLIKIINYILPTVMHIIITKIHSLKLQACEKKFSNVYS